MITDVHIFSPGVQTSAQGVTREFTKKDLKQVASSYEPQRHEAPIRIGHQDDDKVPSWGWVKNVKMKGDDLYAEVEFSPLMEDYVKNGLYRKVSASFYSPESNINPEPGNWSLRHVAMLGAQPPAVKGLKGFAYAEESEEDGVLDFAVSLSPEAVFDKELGPTLKVDQGPLEVLKDKLNEARSEMTSDENGKQELEAQAEEQIEAVQGQEFAEAKKKKAPGKMGAEDAEEELDDDDDTVESKEKNTPGKDFDKDGDDSESDRKEFMDAKKKAIKKSMDEDTSDNKESDAKKDKKMAAKDVKEAAFDKKKGKGKRAGELMADADQDNKDADVDEENDFASGCGKKSYKEGEDEDMEFKGKKSYKEGKKDYSEIVVPEGYDIEEYKEGFQQACSAYVEALEIGGDVEYSEDEDVSPSFDAGVKAGLEYAEAESLRDGKASSVGSAKHDDKCCDEDEEAEGEGPVASKVKKQPKDGECCEGDAGEYEEPTFDPTNKKGSTKKRGTDNLNSSDVGVKETVPYSEEEDETLHAEKKVTVKAKEETADGRNKVGKAGESGKTDRNEIGKTSAEAGTGTAQARAKKGTSAAQDKARATTGKDGQQEADRKKTGKASPQDEKDRGESISLGGKPGSGSAVKKPQVRVMYVGKKGGAPAKANFSESTDFSELTARLEALEAQNAKLVQEKAAAEKRAHRMQIEEFAESIYASGRLTEAVVEQEGLVDYIEGLEYGTLEFAEGESSATKLMDILAALPAQVSFDEFAGGSSADIIPFESMDPHEKAVHLAKEEGLDYAEALKKTLFSAE